jgi:hypothetical protein
MAGKQQARSKGLGLQAPNCAWQRAVAVAAAAPLQATRWRGGGVHLRGLYRHIDKNNCALYIYHMYIYIVVCMLYIWLIHRRRRFGGGGFPPAGELLAGNTFGSLYGFTRTSCAIIQAKSGHIGSF